MLNTSTRLIVLCVRVCAWALRLIASTLVARLAVAAIVLYLAAILTFYALWIGTMLWFVVGRFGIVRNPRRKRRAALATAAAASSGLACWCAVQGSSPVRCVAVAMTALMGAFVWFNKHAVLTAARDEYRTAAKRLR